MVTILRYLTGHDLLEALRYMPGWQSFCPKRAALVQHGVSWCGRWRTQQSKLGANIPLSILTESLCTNSHLSVGLCRSRPALWKT